MQRVLLIAGVIIGLVSAAPAETPFCTSQLDLVNKNLDSLQWVGVAVVTFKLGEQPCFMVGGEIELGSGVAPGPNTVFELASVTKVFTTAILAMRSNQGFLNPIHAVKPHLPPDYVLQPEEQDVTFQQLATFTGGFSWSDPPGYTKGEHYSQSEFVTQVNNLVPKHLPTKNHYSNGSVGFLGQILMHMDSSKGRRYPPHEVGFSNWISDNLTGPLNMTNTSVEPAGVPATGYHLNNKGKFVQKDPFLWVPWGAAGALRSTIADMLTFLTANICAHHKSESPCTSYPSDILDALATAHLPNDYTPSGTRADPTIYVGGGTGVEQAYAWRYLVPPVPNPTGVTPILSKNGGHPGFSTLIAFNPHKSYGLVILMNTGGVKVGEAGLDIIQQTHTP